MIVPDELIFFSSAAREEGLGGGRRGSHVVVGAPRVDRGGARAPGAGGGRDRRAGRVGAWHGGNRRGRPRGVCHRGVPDSEPRRRRWEMDADPCRATGILVWTVGALLAGAVAMTLDPAAVALSDLTLARAAIALPSPPGPSGPRPHARARDGPPRPGDRGAVAIRGGQRRLARPSRARPRRDGQRAAVSAMGPGGTGDVYYSAIGAIMALCRVSRSRMFRPRPTPSCVGARLRPISLSRSISGYA